MIQSLKVYFNRRIAVITLMCFSAGVPLLLTGSTLAFWLRQEGISYTAIGLAGLVHLPYAFKFVWSPLVDRMKLPFFTEHFGRRRGWLLFSQTILMLVLPVLGSMDPSHNLKSVIALSLVVAFASATQDTVILAYQVERLGRSAFGAGEASGVFGFRMGLLAGGAGALFLSTTLSWQVVYSLMSLLVGVGFVTTLLCAEPPVPPGREELCSETQKGLGPWLKDAVVGPFRDFAKRQGWVYALILMMTYKLGDNLIGSMSALFYADVGYTAAEIASAVKVFGMWSSMLGGFIGGMLATRLSMLRALFWFALLHGLATFSYVYISYIGYDLNALYLTVAIEHITGGMRLTALFVLQMSLCNPAYAATQMALFTSCVNLGRNTVSGFSGWLADQLTWSQFFTVVSFSSLMPLFVILLYHRKLNRSHTSLADTAPLMRPEQHASI
ncbi:MAG: AmpG family muropeptide MFS transporter [Holosporales bacterium]